MPVIDKGLELRPGNPGLMLLKASVLLERGALEQAGELLGTLCSVDVDAFIDTTLSFDRRLFTLTAPHLLGVTLLRQGRIAEAAAAFARVSTRVPADRDYAANAAALVILRLGVWRMYESTRFLGFGIRSRYTLVVWLGVAIR